MAPCREMTNPQYCHQLHATEDSATSSLDDIRTYPVEYDAMISVKRVGTRLVQKYTWDLPRSTVGGPASALPQRKKMLEKGHDPRTQGFATNAYRPLTGSSMSFASCARHSTQPGATISPIWLVSCLSVLTHRISALVVTMTNPTRSQSEAARDSIGVGSLDDGAVGPLCAFVMFSAGRLRIQRLQRFGLAATQPPQF